MRVKSKVFIAILSLLFNFAIFAQNITEIEVCAGSVVTLSAQVENGGAAPTFQWIKNDIPIEGATDAIFFYIPENEDVIFCEVTSDEECASPISVISTYVVIKVNPKIDPIFDLILEYCVGDIPLELPTTSINGVKGDWSPTTISTTSKGETIYTFTPNTDECVIGTGIVEITVTVNECIPSHTVFGTVFPFVKTGDVEFDAQFVTTARLYHVPSSNIYDKLGYIRMQIPMYGVIVTHYDCHVDDPIIGAPLNPGTMGSTKNPGLPIKWENKGIINPGIPNTDIITETDKCPLNDIGKFIFENIIPDDYVIEISRPGFLSRYGLISVTADGYLGHRELLGGDVNNDMIINEKDLSTIQTKISSYGNSTYNWVYDLNGNQVINSLDINIIRVNLGASPSIYQETEDWLNQ